MFEERGNRSTRKKTSRCRVENRHTQPTYDAESGNRTRATLVGGKCSHHCAIPAPQDLLISLSSVLIFFRSANSVYAVNQCFDPRNLVSPRYKNLKVSVLFSENSVLCSDPKRIGNILKNHFANIGDKLASEIPNAVSTILIPWTLRSILT